MNDIQFLIIGAQKAGTTSLFEYVRRHPGVHMPSEKEIGFFSVERNFQRGAEWYRRTVLRDAPASAVVGEASVSYMDGTTTSEQPAATDDCACRYSPREDVVPTRIRQLLPDVRLVCVLRDPVIRAYSHYQMAILEGVESRSFDDAVSALLEPHALADARAAPTGDNRYVVNGEYHRVLAGFLRIFPPDRLLVTFSSDLADRPTDVLVDVFRHIGVSDDYKPPNLGVRYRVAATDQRVKGLDLYSWQARMASNNVMRALWRHTPRRSRELVDQAFRVLGFRVSLWNARREGTAEDAISLQARHALIEHFKPDSEALSDLLARDIPWLATWA